MTKSSLQLVVLLGLCRQTTPRGGLSSVPSNHQGCRLASNSLDTTVGNQAKHHRLPKQQLLQFALSYLTLK